MFYPFEVEKYLGDLLLSEDPLLKTIEEEALNETIPIVTPTVGNFLSLLVKLSGSKRILEVGTATGYSTLWLGRAARANGGTVTTIDMNEGRRLRALDNFEKAGLGDIIQSLNGDARKIIPTLQGQYDFVFIDAAKGEYLEYFTLIKPLIAPRGLLVVDNVLFRGWVVPGSSFDDKYNRMVSGLREFLDQLNQDPEFQTSVLPFGDGISMSRKKDN